MRCPKRRARAFAASVGWSRTLGCAGSKLSADACGTVPTTRDFTPVSHQAVDMTKESIDRGGRPVVSEGFLCLPRRPRRTAGLVRPARASAANDRERRRCCVDGRGRGVDRLRSRAVRRSAATGQDHVPDPAQRALLGVLRMSADGSVEGEVERGDVLRHAVPSGRRRCRVPPALRTGGRNSHPCPRTQLLWPKVEPRSDTRLPRA